MIESTEYAEQFLPKMFMTKSLPVVSNTLKEKFRLKMSVQLMKTKKEFTELAVVKEIEEAKQFSKQSSIMSMTSELFDVEEESKVAGLLDTGR